MNAITDVTFSKTAFPLTIGYYKQANKSNTTDVLLPMNCPNYPVAIVEKGICFKDEVYNFAEDIIKENNKFYTAFSHLDSSDFGVPACLNESVSYGWDNIEQTWLTEQTTAGEVIV